MGIDDIFEVVTHLPSASSTTSPSNPSNHKTSSNCSTSSWDYPKRTLCKMVQQRITSGRKVTLNEDLPSSSWNICLRSPKAFSTTQRPSRSLRLNRCSTTPEFSLPLCSVSNHGNKGKQLSPTRYGANPGSAKRISNKVLCWAKWYKELRRSTWESFVLPGMPRYKSMKSF
jgi:hypothetical protein